MSASEAKERRIWSVCSGVIFLSRNEEGNFRLQGDNKGEMQTNLNHHSHNKPRKKQNSIVVVCCE